ncbi:MAG: AraC family transcriptional regulator [Christensenellaceae bacterium]|jgi:predicted transcriptional regulator YdeE
MRFQVDIERKTERAIYGLWQNSCDKTIAQDIPLLTNAFYAVAQKQAGEVLPFYVVSKDYAPATGQFSLFIGGNEKVAGLAAFSLPTGLYGKITIQPKFSFLFGFSIARAKRYFYTKWLPASSYEARNMEYEYHDEKSIKKRPSIDLFFAIQEKKEAYDD